MKLFRIEVTEFVQAVSAQDAVSQARSRNPRAAIIGAEPVTEEQAATAQYDHLDALLTDETDAIARELRQHNETARALALGKIVYGKKRMH